MATPAATKHSPASTTATLEAAATGNTGHHDAQVSAEQRADHEPDSGHHGAGEGRRGADG